jgi:transcription elongation factor Elf1
MKFESENAKNYKKAKKKLKVRCKVMPLKRFTCPKCSHFVESRYISGAMCKCKTVMIEQKAY